MAANINDKFSEVSTGTRPATTTVANVRSVSGSSLVCDDLTGWATNTAVHFATYEVDGQGGVVAGTQQDMKGIVSGNTISSIVVTGGTDIGNKVGDVVQQLPTAAWAKDLADGISVMHNQDGTHKISDLPELATAAADDVLEITDVSTTTSNKIQAKNLAAAVVTGMADGALTPEKFASGIDPHLVATDSVTIYKVSEQSITKGAYYTLFDLSGAYELVSATFSGIAPGCRLTIDGTVVLHDTTQVRGNTSDAAITMGSLTVPPARSATSLKLEIRNNSAGDRTFGAWAFVRGL